MAAVQPTLAAKPIVAIGLTLPCDICRQANTRHDTTQCIQRVGKRLSEPARDALRCCQMLATASDIMPATGNAYAQSGAEPSVNASRLTTSTPAIPSAMPAHVRPE